MYGNFVFHAPTRLVFGPNSVDQAGAEAAALRVRRFLIFTGPGPTRSSPGLARLRASLEAAGVVSETWSRVGHDPDAPAVEAAARAVVDSGCDGVLAFGGGSPIDCAKAASLFASNVLAAGAPLPGKGWLDFVYGRARFDRPGLPLVAVPTTAGSGSEMSSNAVTIDPGEARKLGLSSAWFFPAVALVDPLVQATMPAALAAATGMDALTHAVESFVSRRSTPLTRAVAGQAAGLILGNLERVVAAPDDTEARAAMALASSEVAIAFSQTGLGMVHGFAHPVGARGGVAHGVANAVILPHVAEACARTNPGPFAELALAAGLSVAGLAPAAAAAVLIEAIARTRTAVGIPARLSDLGLSPAVLPAVLADALSYRNRAASPRVFTDEELTRLLDSMY
jgi:alcohol dehydrogenase